MTGPPLISVSLLARAISFLSLMASIVGLSPAAPTIPVTTVSADEIVAASKIPSSPWTMSGILEHPFFTNNSFNSLAASGVESDATLGLYFMTCSAMSSTFVPALKASTSKLSGQTSTMSNVCVPMLPVDPKIDNRFLKSVPFKASFTVSSRDSTESTGAAGLLYHPSPVPLLPEIGSANKLVDEDLMEEGVKADALPNKARPDKAIAEIFIFSLFFQLRLFQVIVPFAFRQEDVYPFFSCC
mmetsp:Transcript_1524/g.2069  ORF Transcript_1524/g.2069 Transcript_1524/m.2069 type:complete len:242 (+) Transcript_1524:919-1644(+)